ncbi:MAG: GNAT family N-acetyltransferase [bacterium]
MNINHIKNYAPTLRISKDNISFSGKTQTNLTPIADTVSIKGSCEAKNGLKASSMKLSDIPEFLELMKNTDEVKPKPTRREQSGLKQVLTELIKKEEGYDGNVCIIRDNNGSGKIIAEGGVISYDKKNGYVFCVFVARNMQEKGLGNSIMKTLINQAKEKKYEQLSLYTLNPIAEKLYKKNGFKNCTSAEAGYGKGDERYPKAVYMKLDLNKEKLP